MMIDALFRNRQLRSGFTLIEAVTAVGLIAICVALVLPMLSKTRDDARIDQCADHLRQLAAVNLQYASDNKGKFFYDWGRPRTIDGKEEGNWRARWWDKERAGRYVDGVALQWKPPVVAVKLPGQDEIKRFDDGPFVNDAGLGGGPFICPADDGASRSYHQNFWASGVDASLLPPQADRSSESWKQLPGIFFAQNDAVKHDRLILFSEMLALYPAEREPRQESIDWATGGEFGSQHTSDIRFAGTDWPGLRYRNPSLLKRWHKESFPVQLDYTRHLGDRLKDPLIGGVNIAYADGHVAWQAHTDLYDSKTSKSSYQTLWSPIDEHVDQMLEKGSRHCRVPAAIASIEVRLAGL